MTLERIAAYSLAFIMIMVMLLRLLLRPTSVQARDISGIAVAGDKSGSISQNRTEIISPASATERPAEHGDRVGWAIGAAGVLIAVAQFAFDVLKK